MKEDRRRGKNGEKEREKKSRRRRKMSVPPHDQSGNERKQEMRRFIALPDI